MENSEFAQLDESALTEYVMSLADIERDPDYDPFSIRIGPFSTIVMVGMMQLAMRHPDLVERHKDIARQIIDQIAVLFAGTPGEVLIARGWAPGADVAAEESSNRLERYGKAQRDHAAALQQRLTQLRADVTSALGLQRILPDEDLVAAIRAMVSAAGGRP